jgi:hypothetical protein
VGEPESIWAQIFVRFVGGASAIVVGTLFAYWLVIGRYLERLERYKEKLRVCKELYARSRDAIRGIESFQGYSESVDEFSSIMSQFNEYFESENELFIPTAVKEQCQAVISAQASVVYSVETYQYPKSPAPVQYSEEKLINLTNQLRSLNDMIKRETESVGFRVPKRFTEWYKGLAPRLPGWCRKVWECLRSDKGKSPSGD